MATLQHAAACVAALVLVGCATAPAERAPLPLTPPADVKSAPVVRAPAPPAVVAPPSVAAPKAREPAVVAGEVPAGTLYLCVAEVGGKRQQVAIAFDRKVEALCRKHPEMGPCQYERNICRRGGGRVYTAAGEEITAAHEAEYDRKVMRARFKSN